MAHVHGFLSGELGLFEDLESRGEKKDIDTTIFVI